MLYRIFFLSSKHFNCIKLSTSPQNNHSNRLTPVIAPRVLKYYVGIKYLIHWINIVSVSMSKQLLQLIEYGPHISHLWYYDLLPFYSFTFLKSFIILLQSPVTYTAVIYSNETLGQPIMVFALLPNFASWQTTIVLPTNYFSAFGFVIWHY